MGFDATVKRDVAHGPGGYAKGCRCKACKKSARSAAIYQRNKSAGVVGAAGFVMHGKVSTYNNRDCRCDQCVAAFRAEKRRGVERHRSEDGETATGKPTFECPICGGHFATRQDGSLRIHKHLVTRQRCAGSETATAEGGVQA